MTATAPGTPQAAIFVEETGAHWFQHFAVARDAGAEPVLAAVRTVQDTAAAAPAPVHLVVGFGSDMTGRLGLEAPPGLKPFTEIAGSSGRRAVATQEDVFFWIHGDRHDLNFEVALAARRAFDPIGLLARETPSWVYRDSRDLTGFVDGTGNPTADARFTAALTEDGGSFVLAQRWVHDLSRFAALPVGDQERVFGRTKADSVELTGDAMPKDSHVSRTDLPGTKIWRRSAPVGGARDPGLFFLAFGADVARFLTLLRSMFGLTGDGLHDRMLRFTRPITGSFYYAPPVATLKSAFGG